MSRVVYVNGKFVPENEASISIYDSALMFGDMVFDMTRSYNKKQFKLRKHLERLFRSMNSVNISIDLSIDEMEKACLQTIEKNEPFFGDDDEHWRKDDKFMADVHEFGIEKKESLHARRRRLEKEKYDDYFCPSPVPRLMPMVS